MNEPEDKEKKCKTCLEKVSAFLKEKDYPAGIPKEFYELARLYCSLDFHPNDIAFNLYFAMRWQFVREHLSDKVPGFDQLGAKQLDELRILVIKGVKVEKIEKEAKHLVSELNVPKP